MTHKDIYTKFMIEYDKANVTSSYPSLTEYEVATVLDKAYHALIAQKVTGNNVRRVALEGDLKSVTDISPLIKNKNISASKIDDTNLLRSELPQDYLYFITANMMWPNVELEEQEDADTAPHEEETALAYDGIKYRKMPIKLVSHDMANNFIASSYNIPWVKIPVCFVEENIIYTVYDSFKSPKVEEGVNITYIKNPNKFVKDFIQDDRDQLAVRIGLYIRNNYPEEYSNLQTFNQIIEWIRDTGEFEYDYEHETSTQIAPPCITWDRMSYFEGPSISYNTGSTEQVKAGQYTVEFFKNAYNFECNDTMAEELISLAVAFALENVESQRLNSKLNMRGLEA